RPCCASAPTTRTCGSTTGPRWPSGPGSSPTASTTPRPAMRCGHATSPRPWPRRSRRRRPPSSIRPPWSGSRTAAGPRRRAAWCTSGGLGLGGLAGLAGEEPGQVVADRLLELLEPARGRVAVRAPADELGRVPEPRALHVLVAHLDHPLGAQRDERQVLARVPPAGLR